MFCKKCGKEIKDGTAFCNYCGEKVTFTPEAPLFNANDGFGQPAPVNAAPVSNMGPAPVMQNNAPYSQPMPQPQPQTQYIVAQAPDTEPYNPAYKPIGAWGYFGYNLLFAIPLVGFICLIVFSLSNENINRRNYARSFWCWFTLVLIAGLIFGVLGLLTGGDFISEFVYMFY